MSRQEGYYRVRWHSTKGLHSGIAYYKGNRDWERPGSHLRYDDGYFDWIDETPIQLEPQEVELPTVEDVADKLLWALNMEFCMEYQASKEQVMGALTHVLDLIRTHAKQGVSDKDIEEKAEAFAYVEDDKKMPTHECICFGYTKGYKQAIKENAGFTEADIRESWLAGIEFGAEVDGGYKGQGFTDFLTTLKDKK